MMRFARILTFCSVLALASAGPAHEKIIVCYTTGEVTSNGTDFPIESTDLNLCTHLIYAENLDVQTHAAEPWEDTETKSYEKFTNLRQKYPHLKVSLGIKHFLIDYIRIAADEESIWDFAKNATDFVLRHKLDGIDLLWEFSEISDVPVQPNQLFVDNLQLNKSNLERFVKRLKKTFKLHNLLLTSTFVATNENIADVIDITALSRHFDYVHFVQKYNFNLRTVGDVIDYAIRVRGLSNSKMMIDGLINRGVSPDKIVLGLQFTGLLFQSSLLFGHSNGPVYRKSLGYNEVCDIPMKSPGWEKLFNAESGLTILKRIEISPLQLPQLSTIVYESSRMIVRKVQLALSRNLAGALVFPIDMDDFVGKCAVDKDTFVDFKASKSVNLNIETREDSKFPLLRTVNEAILTKLEKATTNTQVKSIPIRRIIEHQPSATVGQKVNAPTVRIVKVRRPIQNINVPFKQTYDDYDIDMLDALLSI